MVETGFRGVFNAGIGATVTYLTDRNGSTTRQQYARNAAVDFTVGAVTSGAASLAKFPTMVAAVTNVPIVKGIIAGGAEIYKGVADYKGNVEIGAASAVAAIVNGTGVVSKGVAALAENFGIQLEGHVLKPGVSALLQPTAGSGEAAGALTERLIGAAPDFGLNLGGAILGEKLGGDPK